MSAINYGERAELINRAWPTQRAASGRQLPSYSREDPALSIPRAVERTRTRSALRVLSFKVPLRRELPDRLCETLADIQTNASPVKPSKIPQNAGGTQAERLLA